MAVTVFAHQLKDIASRLPSEADARKAASRAINRAMDAGTTAALRQVAKDYDISQGKIKPRITKTRADTKNLSASVTWRGGALSLTDFNVTPGEPNPSRRPLVRAIVSRAVGPKAYRGVFLIKASNGVKAFRRTSAARNAGSRYPITAVYGPSIPQLLGARSVKEAVESRAAEVLPQRLEHEINQILRRGR
jgi:hypothetical protein